MIHVGTCGYSYADWKGPFYPPTIASAAMLPFYARTFTAVEVDATYYRVPPRSTFAALAARVPPGFRFCVKLPGSATHLAAADFGTIHPDVARLRANLEPLLETGALAAALMQFPHGFVPGATARAHIVALRDALPDLTLAAEFRHRAWQTHPVLEFLRELDIGWVNVDMPDFETLMQPASDVTSGIAYVRFHGRNRRTWWAGTNVTRYDYDYRADELGPWADQLIDIAANTDAREVLAFFNNHRRGQAARNAQLFEAMLRERFAPAVAVAPAPPPHAEQLTLDLQL